ncbi:YidH family protein [Rhodococcus sp. NCIMB 12038]|uniref:YidH family protein n=1 Tax=Rhodococcus sp. NCIMB 12038 TaxID=933800 RepID=UPI000B3C7CAC|nr:DUF202 domain-containing protein [Rhodococcus sp. NCIMB 12038]OUS82234.1 hypothetical protein CA951_41230 [Rhodococcus sp. NCIMB 12038]
MQRPTRDAKNWKSKPFWPSHTYAGGSDPDYRFSLANERTFLAWIRTSLALVAASVALRVVDTGFPPVLRKGLALALLGLGCFAAVAAFVRWTMSERAMRRGRSLPRLTVALPLAIALILIAGVVVGTVV